MQTNPPSHLTQHFPPAFYCLPAEGAAACPESAQMEVSAGLIAEDTRPIAQMPLVLNPLSNFCSFVGWQKHQEVLHTKYCVAFSFMAILLEANLCLCRGFLGVELVMEGMGWGESVPRLRPLQEQRMGMVEPSLWRCSAETASPVPLPVTWDRNSHHPGDGGLWKSSVWTATTESFLHVKPTCEVDCQIFRWPKLWKYSIDLPALVGTENFHKEKGRTIKLHQVIL